MQQDVGLLQSTFPNTHFAEGTIVVGIRTEVGTAQPYVVIRNQGKVILLIDGLNPDQFTIAVKSSHTIDRIQDEGHIKVLASSQSRAMNAWVVLCRNHFGVDHLAKERTAAT